MVEKSVSPGYFSFCHSTIRYDEFNADWNFRLEGSSLVAKIKCKWTKEETKTNTRQCPQ